MGDILLVKYHKNLILRLAMVMLCKDTTTLLVNEASQF